MQAQTIEIEFKPSDLPKWAQKHPEVVERCRVDLSFRCNVYDVRDGSGTYARALIKDAKFHSARRA